MSRLSPSEWTLRGYGDVVDLPDRLRPESEPLAHGAVVELWTDHFNEKRVVFLQESRTANLVDTTLNLEAANGYDLLFCSNGHGHVISVPRTEPSSLAGSTFKWEIIHSPASRWWSPSLSVQHDTTPLLLDGRANYPFDRSGTPHVLGLVVRENSYGLFETEIIATRIPDEDCTPE